MAKKVVATLKKAGSGRDWAKVIKCVKSSKTGAYSFRDEMMPTESVKDALAK
jgi:hypothetical protein